MSITTDIKDFALDIGKGIEGNTGDPDYIPMLAHAMEDKEEIVREYSAWALGKIGGPKSKSILESSLRREISSAVIDEIKAALANPVGSNQN